MIEPGSVTALKVRLHGSNQSQTGPSGSQQFVPETAAGSQAVNTTQFSSQFDLHNRLFEQR